MNFLVFGTSHSSFNDSVNSSWHNPPSLCKTWWSILDQMPRRVIWTRVSVEGMRLPESLTFCWKELTRSWLPISQICYTNISKFAIQSQTFEPHCTFMSEIGNIPLHHSMTLSRSLLFTISSCWSTLIFVLVSAEHLGALHTRVSLQYILHSQEALCLFSLIPKTLIQKVLCTYVLLHNRPWPAPTCLDVYHMLKVILNCYDPE